MKEALILFSGGKDSFLSSLKALEDGYKINLVTFDNGNELNCKNVLLGAKRIQKKYGQDKVNIIGIKKTDALWRELIIDFYNYDLNKINKDYENMTISEFNCLSCRLAMYILSIIICKQNNIKYVFDGARSCQLFAIEQPPMLEEFKKLFKDFNIEILYPLCNETNDYSIKNEILARGFVPKMNEAQCLLGTPTKRENNDTKLVSSCLKVYEKELYPKVKYLVEKYSKITFEGKYL